MLRLVFLLRLCVLKRLAMAVTMIRLIMCINCLMMLMLYA